MAPGRGVEELHRRPGPVAELSGEEEEEEKLSLTLFQRLILWVNGRVVVGEFQHPGWKGPIKHYAFRCKKNRRHGIQVTWPNGWQRNLQCPECIEEDLARSFKPTLTEREARHFAGLAGSALREVDEGG